MRSGLLTDKMANSTTVHMAAVEEGLGRIMFVAGAPEHERPFLGSLYKFLTMHPRNSVRRVFPYVAFILRYLSKEIMKRRHYLCGMKLTSADCIPRVDKQASTERTGIGGWFLARNNSGKLDQWCSDWFPLEVTKEHFPWVFEKGENHPGLSPLWKRSQSSLR